MDNYFDIATPEELKAHYGYTPKEEELSADRLRASKNKDYNLEYLACLFAERGDFSTAEKYIDQISDEMRKSDVARLLAHDDAYFDWLAKK